jgi:carboxypeptidase C (cathepsin A)
LTDEYVPCEDDYADTYLNDASVKKALNVKLTTTWASCSNKLKYNSTDSQVSTAPIYNYLIDGKFGLDILVYSGDDDAVCATIGMFVNSSFCFQFNFDFIVGTQSWIWDLGYTIAAGQNWKTYTVNQQTAGYATQWKDTKLGFLTVHGAGHEVPTYKPEVALDLWKKYLNGEFTKA